MDETAPNPSIPTKPAYVFQFNIRYLEVDQQGVVNNMWYLAYVDDAMTGFLEHNGLRYETLVAAGYECQLINAQLTWKAGLRWGAPAKIETRLSKVGTTSFTLDYVIRQHDEVIALAAVVYVCVSATGEGKKPLPELLRRGIGLDT